MREVRGLNVWRNLFLGAALCIGAASASPLPALAQAAAAPASQPDIAGVRIGMTEAEARASLRAFDSTLAVRPVMGFFNYSDGVNHMLKTPEFLDRLEGVKGGDARLKVFFSGPVGDVRVIGVWRHEVGVSNPPSRVQFSQGLAAKYGRPSGDNQAGRLVWEVAGKPSCIRHHVGQKIEFEAFDGIGLLDNASVEKSIVQRRADVMARASIPADPRQCGAYVSYMFFGDPVRSFTAHLFDMGAMVASERSRAAWGNQLRTEATRKRQGQAQTPRL